MSENGTSFADSSLGGPASIAPMSAGAMLRSAREQSGLHIAALAVALKIPVRKLELLEADRYDELPGAVFIRALASSVCRNLKIDPKEILARLPASHAPMLATDNGGLDPFRSTGGGNNNNSTAQQISRPVIIAVLILLLAALVLIFMPSINRSASAPESAVSVITPANDPAATPAPPPVSAMTPGTGPAETFAPPEPGSTAAAASEPVAAPAPKVAGTPATVTPATVASAASPSAAAPAAGIVSFTASGQSWIQVTDAKGVVALETTLTTGQTVAANGATPLRVIVGRADATKVNVRGKTFDVAPYSRDNVARFEVK